MGRVKLVIIITVIATVRIPSLRVRTKEMYANKAFSLFMFFCPFYYVPDKEILQNRNILHAPGAAMFRNTLEIHKASDMPVRDKVCIHFSRKA